MKLVISNGSSCSGKSTIVDIIMQKKEHYFHLSYDRLKRLFSKYSPSEQYEDVRRIVFAVADEIFKMGYDVINDSALYQASRMRLINLAKKYNYEIMEINLEADYEILCQRFDERVASALSSPSGVKPTNLSKERFKELVEIYNKEKNPSAITFRTDTQSIENVANSVMKLL